MAASFVPKPNRDGGRAAESQDCHITLRKLSQGHSVVCDLLLAPTFVQAQDQPDKAAAKQATATCRTEVKEHAKYNEMSLWAQHKAIKKCIADALARH